MYPTVQTNVPEYDVLGVLAFVSDILAEAARSFNAP